MGKLNNIEFYKKHEEVLKESMKRGITSITIMGRITIYDFYKEERKTEKKMQAIQNTVDKFNISQRTVYNTISMMQTH